MSRNVPARAEQETNLNIHSASYPGDRTKCLRSASVSRKRLRYRGIGLVWTAIFLTLMILLVGLMLDTGKVAYNIHQMQNAADAAALAGARIVKIQDADVTRLLTHDIGFANAAEGLAVTLRYQEPYVQPEPFVDETNLDIILGRWISHLREFFPTLDTPDAVKVIARRADGLADAPALALVFGPIAGVDTANASRMAIGWHNAISGAGLIVLDRNAGPGLEITGAGEVRVIGGTIHVNSTATGTGSNPSQDPAAVYVNSTTGKMLCGRLTVTGHTDPAPGDTRWESIWTDDAGAQVPYDITEGAGYLPDPLGYLVAPPIPTDPTTGEYLVASNEKITTTQTLNPGYYPRGIDVTGTTTVTLNAGTYWLGGGNPSGNQIDGLYMNGGTLTGYGVLIYLTKDYVNAGGKWARLDIGGNVAMDITPPGDEVYPKIKNGLEGVSIWQDRANDALENTASLHGGAGMNISGTLYFPNNRVYLAGTPGKAGNQIICGSVQVAGRAPIVVEYDGRNGLYRGKSILVQ